MFLCWKTQLINHSPWHDIFSATSINNQITYSLVDGTTSFKDIVPLNILFPWCLHQMLYNKRYTLIFMGPLCWIFFFEILLLLFAFFFLMLNYIGSMSSGTTIRIVSNFSATVTLITSWWSVRVTLCSWTTCTRLCMSLTFPWGLVLILRSLPLTRFSDWFYFTLLVLILYWWRHDYPGRGLISKTHSSG